MATDCNHVWRVKQTRQRKGYKLRHRACVRCDARSTTIEVQVPESALGRNTLNAHGNMLRQYIEKIVESF